MKKAIALLLAIFISCGISCFAQGKVTRQKKETTETRQKPTKTKLANQQQNSAQSTPTKSNKPLTGTINGHEWVDLGLPSGLKWATCNVGASTPEDDGDKFYWGETKPVSSSSASSKSLSTLRLECVIDSSDNLTSNHDAARANWGQTWRLPKKEEFDELINKCQWKWSIKGSNSGCKVIGPNGNSIFLPVDLFGEGSPTDLRNGNFYYWSATASDQGAYNIYIFKECRGISDPLRHYVKSAIRPVSD